MKLMATLHKELLLLLRDRSGLLVLFLMPAVLVVVVSLVQENILKSMGETRIKVLFLDQDQSLLGEQLKKEMFSSGSIEFVSTLNSHTPTLSQARQALLNKDFQLVIHIPQGLTKSLTNQARALIRSAVNGPKGGPEPETHEPALQVFFDPLAQGSFRFAVENALQRVMLNFEIKLKAQVLSRTLAELQGTLPAENPEKRSKWSRLPELNPDWAETRLSRVEMSSAAPGRVSGLPSSVQHNVPAWSIFGIFFIVVPLSGSIIRERQAGTLVRLLTMPVSYSVLVVGKILAYILVCLAQFTLILVIGKFILPLLGTPGLDPGSDLLAVFLVVVFTAFAAAGYGILLGTLAKTYEQCSMFGAVSVVIAAALGGIMVPVYVMPEVMQEISRFSPLYWALDSLTNLLARDKTLIDVSREIVYLFSFATGCMLLAWLGFARQDFKS